MNHKDKLYFPDWDDEYCSDLEDLKLKAKEEGIMEFDATEAIPENMRNTNIFWCSKNWGFVDMCD